LRVFFQKSVEKIKILLKSDKNYGDAQGKSYRENQNAHFIFKRSPPPENRAVYEITWKNISVDPDKLQMTIWRRRISRWIHKATKTLSEYVPYFPAHKTHCDFFVRNFRKKIMMKVF